VCFAGLYARKRVDLLPWARLCSESVAQVFLDTVSGLCYEGSRVASVNTIWLWTYTNLWGGAARTQLFQGGLGPAGCIIAVMMNRRDALAIAPLLLLNAAASRAEAQATPGGAPGPGFPTRLAQPDHGRLAGDRERDR